MTLGQPEPPETVGEELVFPTDFLFSKSIGHVRQYKVREENFPKMESNSRPALGAENWIDYDAPHSRLFSDERRRARHSTFYFGRITRHWKSHFVGLRRLYDRFLATNVLFYFVHT